MPFAGRLHFNSIVVLQKVRHLSFDAPMRVGGGCFLLVIIGQWLHDTTNQWC
jgi:hypothetical protein